MTVKEYITEHSNDTEHSYWCCPSILKRIKITTPPKYLSAVEFQSLANCPKEILDKTVVKTWLEDGFRCIIWHNTEEY